MQTKIASRFSLLALMCGVLFFLAQSIGLAQTLPNQTPDKFTATNDGFDYVRREVMIPMRDGVKLHTVILLPKSLTDGKGRAPMLLTRTPYDASKLTQHINSSHLGPS